MTALSAAARADDLADLCEPLETKSAADPAEKPARGGDTIEALAIETARLSTKSAGDIKALGEQMQKLHDEFKAHNDRAETSRNGRGADPVDEAPVDKLNGAMDKLNGEIKDLKSKLERAERKAARPSLGGDPVRRDEKSVIMALAKKAALHHLRTGETVYKGQSVHELQRKALSVGTPADGGVIVLPEQGRTIIEANMATWSPMRNYANVRTTSAYKISDVVSTGGGAASGWVGETAARPATATPQLTALEITAMELYANPAATQMLLDDAEVDMEAWLADKVARGFAEQEATAFITGDGSGKPKGLLGQTMVANASWAWGSLGFIVSGAAATIGTSHDKLIDLTMAIKAGYRANASWLMNRTTQASVRKLKDSAGQYLWQPSRIAGQPNMLDGYAVVEIEEMPAEGANTFPIAFGDIKQAYTILDRLGVRVIRDPYTNKPYVHFYTTKRVGGDVTNFEAVKLLKCSA